ncbi:unnamed protein product [Sphagnum jensenii]|uniref:Uncharacterized protein n=1 Tax=Sphagnum jensenii TaxID=128206 RepID=A0ABP0VFV4_9BRYO
MGAGTVRATRRIHTRVPSGENLTLFLMRLASTCSTAVIDLILPPFRDAAASLAAPAMHRRREGHVLGRWGRAQRYGVDSYERLRGTGLHMWQRGLGAAAMRSILPVLGEAVRPRGPRGRSVRLGVPLPIAQYV